MPVETPPRSTPLVAGPAPRDGLPVLRFAPSPNGELHLGHALSALTTFEAARALGGRFLLRIEDIDPTRTRPEYVECIFRDLAWLGLTWEEPVLFQSQRLPAYRAAADRLAEMSLLYPCFATRSEIEAASDPARCDPAQCDPDGAPLYPGLWRHRPAADVDAARAAGLAFALRLDMEAALARAQAQTAGAALTFVEGLGDEARTISADPARWGDAILVRKDTPTSYHLAVVVDDAAQGITHVTRGLDLFPATDLHRLLQVLLDLPAPIYAHHRLVTDARGRKLSKSARDESLRAMRERGVRGEEVWGMGSDSP